MVGGCGSMDDGLGPFAEGITMAGSLLMGLERVMSSLTFFALPLSLPPSLLLPPSPF